MTFIKNLEEVKGLCRICLISSNNMVSLYSNLDDKSNDSLVIVDVLENLLMVKIDDNVDYPVDICSICRGNLRIIHDLKVLFTKSQNILKKYVSSLHEFEELDSVQSSVSPKPSDELIDLSDESVMDTIETSSHEESSGMQKQSVKVKIDSKKQVNVSVKWLEGNKFILEKHGCPSPSVNKCKHCRKVFTSKQKLSSHLYSCMRNVSCEYCNGKFLSERSLRHHMRTAHSSNKPLEIKCELCDETFKNYNARSYHKITRHDTKGKRHTCEICGKAFYFRNSLNQHLECHSRNVSRVVCPVCGKSFHYRGGLFYHMKIHRNERNYVCTFCNGKFLNMASLKRHTRIHTGERPYTCSFCSKTFCSISEVRTHERRHTGQKPHPCKYCHKRFITPYNLKLHMSAHTGKEQCDVCGKSYLNDEVLKFHKEMKHNIKETVQ